MACDLTEQMNLVWGEFQKNFKKSKNYSPTVMAGLTKIFHNACEKVASGEISSDSDNENSGSDSDGKKKGRAVGVKSAYDIFRKIYKEANPDAKREIVNAAWNKGNGTHELVTRAKSMAPQKAK